jgi:cation diffusion facilitator family transporter
MERRKAAVARLSVASNALLVATKLMAGLIVGSVSVISEAIHSGIDLLASVIALFAVRASAKPADADHAFGHEKWENVSGTVEALLIFIAAGWIAYEAVRRLMHPTPLASTHLGVGVMLLSVVLNIGVSKALFRVGREARSPALLADAWHLLTDVWTSLGVMAALAAIWLGRLWLPALDLRWLDPVAALCVAALILQAAWRLTVEAGRDLLDTSLPQAEINWIGEYIRSLSPRICSFHDLRTRKAGHVRFIEFHLELHRKMSVEDSHRITDTIEQTIMQRFPGSHVTVHVEPCPPDCRCGAVSSPPDKPEEVPPGIS